MTGSTTDDQRTEQKTAVESSQEGSSSTAAKSSRKSASKSSPTAGKRARKASRQQKKSSSSEYHSASGTRSQADKALERVREVRAENERRAQLHNRTVVVHEITAYDKDGKERDKPIELSAIDQRGYLNTHGEAVLDQDGLIELRQKIEQCFQAVT